MSIFKQTLISFICGVACVFSAGVNAQASFPSKPIHVINPYAAGGVVDVLARVLTERLSQSMGVPFVIESKSGGGGNIGTDYAAKAAPDGNTWLIATTSNAANMALMPKIRTDLLKAFVPVGQIATSPNFFVVPASLPASSVKEYVAMAKASPGKLNYGSAGIGSTPHLGFELFKYVADIDVVAVPYKGAPPIVPDLLAGQLSATYMPSSLAISQAKSSRVKILAVVNDKRSKDFPDIPTMAEAGYPKAVVAPWFAVLVPSATPKPVIQRIENEIQVALKSPEVIARMETAGATPTFRSTDDVTSMIRSEIESWRVLVKASGMKAE